MAESLNIQGRARALLAVNRHAEAAELLIHALSHDPANYQLLYLVAQSLQGMGQSGEACAAIRKAISITPERDEGHRLHSQILNELFLFRESLAAAKEAVRLNPAEPGNWHALANAQLLVVDKRAARASAEKMRELAPESSLTYQMLALVAISEGKFKQAEEHCRRGLELNPISYEGMNNLGVSFSKRGRKRAAADAFHAAAKLNPNRPVARRNLVSSIGLPSLALGQWLGITFLFGMMALCLAGVTGLPWLGVAFLGLILVLAIAATIAQRFRYRRMPDEVQQFYRFAKRKERLAARRTSLRALGIVAVSLLLFWLLVIWSRWDFLTERSVFWLTILPAVLLFLLATGAIVGYWRTGKQLALLGD